jgi:hypothetical protein
MPMLSLTIELGRVIQDRPKHLTFFFREEVVFGKWFQATIKANADGSEIWVTTFHISKPTAVTSRCRRFPILRDIKL